MRVTLNVPDNVICIDGECKSVSLPVMPNVHALQWDGDKGIIEYTNGVSLGLTDLTPYLETLALWGTLPSATPQVVSYIPRDKLPPLTPWQVRKVLNAAGLRAQVEAAVAAADVTAQDAWHYATEFRRNDTVLNTLAAVVGISQAQLDTLFVEGAKL